MDFDGLRMSFLPQKMIQTDCCFAENSSMSNPPGHLECPEKCNIDAGADWMSNAFWICIIIWSLNFCQIAYNKLITWWRLGGISPGWQILDRASTWVQRGAMSHVMAKSSGWSRWSAELEATNGRAASLKATRCTECNGSQLPAELPHQALRNIFKTSSKATSQDQHLLFAFICQVTACQACQQQLQVNLQQHQSTSP